MTRNVRQMIFVLCLCVQSCQLSLFEIPDTCGCGISVGCVRHQSHIVSAFSRTKSPSDDCEMDDSTRDKEPSLELALSEDSKPSKTRAPLDPTLSEPSPSPESLSPQTGVEADGSSEEWVPESVISSEESLEVVARPRGRDLSDVESMSISASDDEHISDKVRSTISHSSTLLQNDEHCAKCNSGVNPQTLLCCDGCPRVYHMHCLEPKLTK